MKTIFILLLLIASLLADCNTTTPSNSMESAKVVAIQGWTHAEKALKEFFEKDGEKYITSFLKCSKQPLDVSFKEDSFELISKINLTRNDVYTGLAYAKYLEDQERQEEALNIYKSVLSGIKQSNSNYASMIGLVCAVVTEKIVANSLSISLQQNIYNDQQLKQLKVFLKDHLLLESSLFSKALENERTRAQKICERDLVQNYNDAEFIKETFNGLINEETLNKFAIKSEAILQKICDNTTKKIEAFDKEILEIATKEDEQKFINNFNCEKNEFYKNLAELPQKSPSEIEKMREDSNNYIHGISSIFFYTGATTKLAHLKLNLITTIEANNKLLELVSHKISN